MLDTTIIILAAGRSARLGTPKQLLPFKNSTLLQHVTNEAIATGAGKVIVVTGAYQEAVTAHLQHLPVQIIHNPDWASGMASSIRKGIEMITDIDKAILTVCDQPYISAALFHLLQQTGNQTRKGIIASRYADTTGTPVLFSSHYFSRLSKLQGEHGAKKIIQQFPDDVATVPFEKGHIDIDQKDDYEKLNFDQRR